MNARLGLSMVETVVSLVVVGTLLAAGMNAVGSTVSVRQHAADVERATWLAHDLMTEVLRAEYGGDAVVFDPFEQDSPAQDRLSLNTVDDYHGLTESPPTERDGKEISWGWGLTRRVQVSSKPEGTGGVAELAAEAKYIRVTVARGKQKLASLVAVMTESSADAWGGP